MDIFINCSDASSIKKYFDQTQIKNRNKSEKDFISKKVEKLSWDSLIEGYDASKNIIFSENFKKLLEIFGKTTPEQIGVDGAKVEYFVIENMVAVNVKDGTFWEYKDDKTLLTVTNKQEIFDKLKQLCTKKYLENEKELHELNMIENLINKNNDMVASFIRDNKIETKGISDEQPLFDKLKTDINTVIIKSVNDEISTKILEHFEDKYNPITIPQPDTIIPNKSALQKNADLLNTKDKILSQEEWDKIFDKSVLKAKSKKEEYSQEEYEKDLKSMFDVVINKYYKLLEEATYTLKDDGTKNSKFIDLLKEYIKEKKEKLNEENKFLMPTKSNMLSYLIYISILLVVVALCYICFTVKDDEFEELNLEDDDTSMVSKNAIEASA